MTEPRLKPGNFDSLHAQHLFYSRHALGIPLVRYQAFDPPQWIVPYRTRLSADRTPGAVHFFLDDFRFETTWNRPYKTLSALSGYGAVMTPDFSLYTDYPPVMQMWNVYRNRWVGAFWQSRGLNVIPCLSWSSVESFAFCFAGLDPGSLIAVSSLATREQGRAHTALFVDGYREMIRQVNPRLVLCYGTLVDDSLRQLAPVMTYPTQSWTRSRLLWANGGSRTASGVTPAPAFRAFQADAERGAWHGWQAWRESLSREEHRALRDYTTFSYEEINGLLRQEMFTSDDRDIYVDPAFRTAAQQLDAALARGRVPENITAYRGMVSPRLYAMMTSQTLPVGARLVDKAFVSTSLSADVASAFTQRTPAEMTPFTNRILVQIDVPAGSAGGYLNGVSKMQADPEYELLLPRETRFRVKGYTLEADGLSQHGGTPLARLHIEVLPASTHAPKSVLDAPPGQSGRADWSSL